MNRTRRALARTSLAVAPLALVAGCTATNPQTTQLQYTPSDGATASLGTTTIASIMILAAAEDAPGTLLARVVNSTSEPVSVTFAAEAPSVLEETFDVAPGSTLAIGPEGEETVTIDPVGAIPGELVPVVITASTGESTEVTVPVLSGVHDEYATLVPTPTSTAPTAPAPGAGGTTPGETGGETGGAATEGEGDGTGEGGDDTQQDPGDIGGLAENEETAGSGSL
ncbi:hypothetical protein [Quadrisphaera sp. DSM 44207]|uniref:hypothetical protein n=1 Tax=Quadrisphaera sp. DSM 44207 TaxID=1881057 RepID=UPI0008892427|nr:hypothetical protein [Quadrisphaera sp. DSM 44207]SDQ62100.1 hypothetical protein SAMN05428996_2117 [Quadrisphaera sp. DSM 44207]